MVLQRLALGVDLSVAVGVQHLQVVTRLLAASTAPNPMVDVPGLLFGMKGLPAHHATSLLLLPEIFDPSSTQGLRITIAILGHMGSFVSRANPYFCPVVLRLFDSVVTNTANFY